MLIHLDVFVRYSDYSVFVFFPKVGTICLFASINALTSSSVILFLRCVQVLNYITHTRGRGITYLLESAGKLLQQLNATCFELSGKKTPRAVILIESASESISSLYGITNSPPQFGHTPHRHQGKSPNTGN
jgi:hypothetical protein